MEGDMRIGRLVAILMVAMVGMVGAVNVAAAANGVPRPDHVVIVIFENHQQRQVIGSANAPYINSLAQTGANFTQSFAITHPSSRIILRCSAVARRGSPTTRVRTRSTTPTLASR
jgi:hypothetical protein